MKSDSCWLAAYLYYAEPWEVFLIEAVRPFTQEAFRRQWAEHFFFIRYWERGPHIRLRFKGDERSLNDKLKPLLEIYFNNYFKARPSTSRESDFATMLPKEQRWLPNNSLLFVPYEPEVDRYGGPIGIKIAEEQFEISSNIILEIIKENKNWSYELGLGVAMQLHLAFAFAFGMSLDEMGQFYRFILNGWLQQNQDLSPFQGEGEDHKIKFLLNKYENSFRSQETSLVSYVRQLWKCFETGIESEKGWLNKWICQMSIIKNKLKTAQTKQELILHSPPRMASEANQVLWPILGSYLHMTNNRLGILNRDEGYLAYLVQEASGRL